MKHLFVPYEIALMAKEKGFNEPCLAMWNQLKDEENFLTCFSGGSLPQKLNGEYKQLTAPLYQQLIDWLRDESCIHVTYDPRTGWKVWDITETVRDFFVTDICTYYEALNAAIIEALTLIPLNK